MREQERFHWSLWPVCVGWAVALWLAWHGMNDLSLLLKGAYPARGFTFSLLSSWPRNVQLGLAVAQVLLLLLALPSFFGLLTRRTLLTVGETGLTFDRWTGWRRVAWRDIAKLEFSLGDAVFHVREEARIITLRFRPWTIGLDSDGMRDLIERHQPRLTPDEDDGQPWGRSSAFSQP